MPLPIFLKKEWQRVLEIPGKNVSPPYFATFYKKDPPCLGTLPNHKKSAKNPKGQNLDKVT